MTFFGEFSGDFWYSVGDFLTKSSGHTVNSVAKIRQGNDEGVFEFVRSGDA